MQPSIVIVKKVGKVKNIGKKFTIDFFYKNIFRFFVMTTFLSKNIF